MNKIELPQGLDPYVDPLDALLADIAINIQLPPSLHSQAVGRYEAVRRFIEREGSELENSVVRFYPQGSMSIDATISHRGTDDEYDLDVVAELDIPPDTAPAKALDRLEKALKGYPVKKIERQTRCITLRYSDNMHLDVTPSWRHVNGPDRQSFIFHAKKGEPETAHFRVPMNAYAFSAWYVDKTPLELRFAEAFNNRLYEAYGYKMAADAAEVDDVPSQTPFIVKNTATVALQLLKRFRNIAYADYSGRMPPSVMLSCFAGRAAAPNMKLADMAILQARMIARAIENASRIGQKLRVLNPMYDQDEFTDRWPESLRQQDQFASKLNALADGLERVRQGNHELEDVQDWLREQFGEGVVSGALRRFNERAGKSVKSGTQNYSKTGGLYVPAAPAIIVGTGTSTPSGRGHTFRGDAP
jgi:hypothetical protein